MSHRSPLTIPGIYAVTNTISGRVYVGQAVNIRKRWEVHRCTLETGNHRNRYLQRAWNKYGADAFRFEVLVDLTGVPRSERAARLNEEEIAALRRFPDTYNLMQAGRSGAVAGPETRALWSAQRKAIWADPVLRQRIVEAMRKRAADPLHQKRRGASLSLYNQTPETKAVRSARFRRMWDDPEHREKQSAKRQANWKDPAYREQQAASRAAAWLDPQKRANRIAGLKAAWVRRKAARAQHA